MPDMRYEIERWSIRDLILEHDNQHLNLNPAYQRNDIWTEKAQKQLISSIKAGMPIPNFFFHKRPNDLYDVADGQQRTRAILAYKAKEISDVEDKYFANDKEFLNYEIPVVVINEDVTAEEIRLFYVKVNNSGLRVNNPELTKAIHFNSKMLALVEGLCELKSFKDLGIFNNKQEERMVDREFVEELVALIEFGFSDKKNAIKRLYEENKDISDKSVNRIEASFEKVLAIFTKLASDFDFKETRYSQKNDFYTLFGLFYKHASLKEATYQAFFSLLVKIQNDISPSNEDCEPLQFYAYRCVSQSNSKSAREDRETFMNELLLNTADRPNKIQKQIIKYYGLKPTELITVENYLTIKPNNIKTKFIEA